MRYTMLIGLLLSMSDGAWGRDFEGRYEQVSPCKGAPPDLRARCDERYERTKITFKIDGSQMHVLMASEGDEAIAMPYKVNGPFLYADAGNENYHWVLYLRDENTILSSFMTFVRVED
jgi:hypothetical protein